MIKIYAKTTLLTLIICATTVVARAQLGYNYSQYEIGFATGFNTTYGDAQTQTTTQSIHFNFTYNQTPYTNFVFEAQFGKLAGGDSVKTISGRQFNNDYSAFIFRGQLQMGEIIDYSRNQFSNAMKNFYVSAGLGYVVNHITNISRYSIQLPGYYTGGNNDSQELFLPLRIGYEFKLYDRYDQPSVKFDIGYQYNYIFGNDLDGFSGPGTKGNDAYTQITLGVKFAIGGDITSYRKRIKY